MSHVSQDFIPVFGDCIRMIRYASSCRLISTILSLPVRSCSQKRPNLSSSAGAVPSAGTRSRPLTPLHLTLFLHVNLRSQQTSLNPAKTHLFSTPDILATVSLTGQPFFFGFSGKLTRTKPRDVWCISNPAQSSDRWYHPLRFPRRCTSRQAVQSSHIHTCGHINRCSV